MHLQSRIRWAKDFSVLALILGFFMQPANAQNAGQQAFRVCGACHSLEPGKTLIGPSLAGIMGRHAGSVPGFDYSPAMKSAQIVWNEATLDAYLKDPQGVVPGNRMPFAGSKSDLDRKEIIAYLAASSGKAAAGGKGTAVSAAEPATPEQAGHAHPMPDMPDVKYTLRTGIANGLMAYIGMGGTIDGKINPALTAAEGQIVQVTLINGEGAEHDVVFPDQGAHTTRVVGKGASTTIAFQVKKAGDFVYYCSVPGHRLAGMEGRLNVSAKAAVSPVIEADLSRNPTDLPPPITRRTAQTVRVDLVTEELGGRLAEGATFLYWTFNGKVPGPFIRVRVGDTVEVHLANKAGSAMVHSVDFHAVYGPGGGASVMQVDPGSEKSFSFKAVVPGLFVYHCATPMVAEHIANGMYGLILVEPEEGLPKVDKEFYFMQGEIYTEGAFGQPGAQEVSVEKLITEHPEYIVFNGAVGTLSKLHPLHAKVGETVRFFFGVGGPNFTSSFHVIGEIFDKVYLFGGLTTPPLLGIQTVVVPPGASVITDLTAKVPGAYSIVDHALSRSERGLGGVLLVEGPANPELFKPGGTSPKR